MAIYDYITEQESLFNKPIFLEDDWYWNFPTHVRQSFLYKNSQFHYKNQDRDKRPFKNIVRPILNIQYRLEGFDVKDIEIFVNNPKNYHKSFLIKKFHEKWALENNMDTLIDDVVESYVDYGGVLVKNVRGVKPEVVDLRTIAFCDQTDILNGTFALKHYFSPEQLRKMSKQGWDADKIDKLILKAQYYKHQDDEGVQSDTPSKYIEIYEVHGELEDSEVEGPEVVIVGMYRDEDNNKVGTTLFRNPEPELPFKFLARDKVQGRALGFGGVEELFEAQAWTNYTEVQKMGMLEMASKTLFWSDDPKFKNQNLANKDNGAVLELKSNKTLQQVDTVSRSFAQFDRTEDKQEESANRIGAAGEVLQGDQPSAGTPFKSLEAQLVENKGLHKWRQGKIATFVDEIYRDWVMPYIAKEITKGQRFLSELTVDELGMVAEKVARNRSNSFLIEKILNAEPILPNELEEKQLEIQEELAKGGSKLFLEILKNEMSGESLDVMTNIAGKQKDLALLTDKVVNLIRQFLATPELRQDREMGKLLNTVLESSGLSPIMFSVRPQQVQAQGNSSTEPLQDFSKAENAGSSQR